MNNSAAANSAPYPSSHFTRTASPASAAAAPAPRAGGPSGSAGHKPPSWLRHLPPAHHPRRETPRPPLRSAPPQRRQRYLVQQRQRQPRAAQQRADFHQEPAPLRVIRRFHRTPLPSSAVRSAPAPRPPPSRCAPSSPSSAWGTSPAAPDRAACSCRCP